MREADFESILSPRGQSEFLAEFLGRRPLHIPGDPEKFFQTLQWKEVEFYLSRGGGNLSRVVVDNGLEKVPESSYTRIGISGKPYIGLSNLIALVAAGAIVTIDAADEVFASVAGLSDAAADVLEVPVTAAVKMSWRRSAGLYPQRQETDALVVQPCGEVEWWIHRQTQICPSAPDPEIAEASSGVPQWHRTVLKQGDCLYIPAGGWYCFRSVNRPSLTLVLSFSAPTAIDILGRIVDQLRRFASMHEACPRFADAAVLSKYLTVIQEELLRACTEPGLVLGFLKDMRAMADPKPLLGLEWSIGGDSPCLPEDWRATARVRYPESIFRNAETDGSEIFFEGSKLPLSGDEERALREILQNDSVILRDLISREPSLSDTLSRLLKRGLIAVCPA